MDMKKKLKFDQKRLNECIKKAKPNLSKIKNVDGFIDDLYKPISEFAWRPASDEEIEKETVPSLRLLDEEENN